jgi:hypothetical protein
MTDTIAGLPFWQVTFDEQGDIDSGTSNRIVGEMAAAGLTDLIVFSHGWNNRQSTARRLYEAWFGQLVPQLAHATKTRPVRVGLVGVFWPSQRWSDEPIPDFAPAAPAAASGGGGAGLSAPREAAAGSTPELDDDTLADLRQSFPAAQEHLDRMAELLAAEPTDAAVEEFMARLRSFAEATAVGGDDGEHDAPDDDGATPRMLEDEPSALFRRYAHELRGSGMDLDEGAGGAAGLGDRFKGIWDGAKEALRQLTYWQMKNRAGVVGSTGLGPFLGRLNGAAPDVRVHLVGHSFGARLVSYALAGLPDVTPSPVKAVTLLQGAFSHFAFADPLPFDATRKGALAGRLARIDGPLTVCFSSHDDAVGRFYPLASIAARDDSAAAADAASRWGGMGHDGAQAVQARLDALQAAGPGTTYRFDRGEALNIDASDVVRRGGPPSGAHSDIVHPELTWVVLAAGNMVG